MPDQNQPDEAQKPDQKSNINTSSPGNADMTALSDNFDAALSILQKYDVPLTENELLHSLHAGPMMDAYVAEVSTVADQVPQYIPGHVNLNAFKTDTETVEKFKFLLAKAETATRILQRRIRVARSESYGTARQISKGYKLAASTGISEAIECVKRIEKVDPALFRHGKGRKAPSLEDGGSQTTPEAPTSSPPAPAAKTPPAAPDKKDA